MEPGRSGPDELAGGSADDAPRRRWPVWVAAGVVLGAGLAVVRPDFSLYTPPQVPNPASSAPVPPSARPLDGVRWPARGDLVGDEAFVAAAMARVRELRSQVTRLYFAGSLPDGSRLVLAGTDVNRGIVATSVHALFVPEDTPVAVARVTEVAALTAPQQVLAWATRGQDGSVQAVAMSRPGPLRFEVSSRVLFGPDGVARRSWSTEPAEDGYVVTRLAADSDPIVVVRADGPGVFSLPLLVRVAGRVEAPPLRVEGVDAPGYAGPDPAKVAQALGSQGGAVADLTTARLEVLWSGAPFRGRRLALVLITREDGQRFQALVGQQQGVAFPAGVRALPRSAPNRLPWLLEPFSPQDPTLLLLPTGDGSVIYRRKGQPVRTWQIGTDGVVGLVAPGPSPPSASGADVTVTDTAGRILLRTTLPPAGFDDPLALADY